jgi:hypothetical protein
MKFQQFLNRKEIMKCYCSQLETGPKLKMARRLARARRAPRARSHRGPGPGRLFPTWATTRSGNREPSIYIQRPRMESGRTKPRRCPRANPRVHSVFLTSDRIVARPDGTTAGPLAGARARRWVDASPSSGSSAEPYPCTTASERPTTLVGGRAARRRMAPPLALSLARAPADGWTHRSRAAPRQGPTRMAMAGPEPVAVSGGSRSTHAASGSIHSWW